MGDMRAADGNESEEKSAQCEEKSPHIEENRCRGYPRTSSSFARITLAITEGDASKWRVRSVATPRGVSNRDAHDIDSLASVVRLLHSMAIRG